MPIRVLDTQLINQIAAGEVVERPASVLKELLENALDAGASRIDVVAEQGGIRLLRVADDGCGIEAEQLTLALMPHATSKISSGAELEAVSSFGFRGEALASIASVSSLSIRSKAHTASQAYSLRAGKDSEPRPAALSSGTVVEVRDLFYNVPARRKFLRTESTEFRHLQQMLERVALARFDVAFSLMHNRRQVMQLPAGNSQDLREARLGRVCGEEFLRHALHVDVEMTDLRLSGWVAQPAFSRNRADLQLLYVNGRAVADKLLRAALRRAYQDVLHYSRYPAFVLNLDLPPQAVDVNVHPQKQEVRFRDAQRIHAFVCRAVRDVLSATAGQAAAAHTMTMATSHPLAERMNLKAPAPASGVSDLPPPWALHAARLPNPAQSGPQQAGLALTQPQLHGGDSKSSAVSGSASLGTGGTDDAPLGRVLAQLHDIFILAENRAGLVLVDMHAAHERVLYERMRAQAEAGHVASQPLLLPQRIAVTAAQAECAEAAREGLLMLGLDVERAGLESVTLRALPAQLQHWDADTLVRDVLADVEQHGGAATLERRLHDVIATLACRGAIKAGRRLSLPEMERLLRDMEGTPRAGMCNHGRPTWVQFGRDELDRLFMRGR